MSKKTAASATAPAPAASRAKGPEITEPIHIPLATPNATSRLFAEDTPPAQDVPPADVPRGTTPEIPAAPAPVPPPPAQEPVAPPAAPPSPEVPAVPAPTTPPAPSDVTFIEDLLAKSNIPLNKVMVRVKVDGKEEVMSYEDAKMRVQLKEHLNLAGQELGTQRRAFAEERRKFHEERGNIQNLGVRQPAMDPAAPTPLEQFPQNTDPLVAQLIGEVKMLRERVQGIDPLVFDANRQRVANELKSQGFPDFMDYIPKIEAHITNLKDPMAIQYYDTDIGSKALYHELKSRDLMEQMSRANRPPAPPPPSAPRSPEPPIIRIDGGSSPSQAGVDNYDAQYEDVLTRWKQTRDPRLFRQILQMKGAAAPA